MKYIAALLTVHNRKSLTLNCLRNLFSQSIPDNYSLDVYLTDDASTDGTPDEIKDSFPDVHISFGNGDLFWNRGMVNSWIEASKKHYDYYFWLNDDTFLYNDSLSRLLALSESHNDKALIVGSTCAKDNHSVITYGGWKDGKLITDLNNKQFCDTINGNIVLVPDFVFQTVGILDPYYRHSLGDTDYGLRAKERGIPCIVGKGVFGECNRHDSPKLWMDPNVPLKRRVSFMLSPLGNNPFEFFHFRNKHFGLFAACATFISNWSHVVFPSLWKNDLADEHGYF